MLCAVVGLVLGSTEGAWSANQPLTSARLGSLSVAAPPFYPSQVSTAAALFKPQHGQPGKGDLVTVAFAGQASQASICSGWSNTLPTESLSGLTITLADGTVGNDVLSVTAAPVTCATGFHLGSVDLGSPGYLSGGNGVFSACTVSLTQTSTTTSVTLTLGTRSGGSTATVSAGSTVTFTPDAAVTDTSNRPASPSTAQSPSVVQF